MTVVFGLSGLISAGGIINIYSKAIHMAGKNFCLWFVYQQQKTYLPSLFIREKAENMAWQAPGLYKVLSLWPKKQSKCLR